MNTTTKAWRAWAPVALALLAFAGCDDDGCNEKDPRDAWSGHAWMNPPQIAVPDLGPPPKCPIEAVPQGLTAEDVEAFLRPFRSIVRTQAELLAVCLQLKRGIDVAIEHSALDVPPADPTARWVWIRMRTWARTQVDVTLGNDLEQAIPCGDGPNGKVVCASDAPIPEGEMAVVAMQMHEPIPYGDPTLHHQLAVVLDADGDAANNYQASPEYPNDLYLDSDRWYEVLVEPGGAASLAVKDARNGNIQVVPSAARVLLTEDSVVAFIPLDELDADCPLFRQTAFVHEGDYGLQPPHWWSGDTEPTVHEPLDELCEG